VGETPDYFYAVPIDVALGAKLLYYICSMMPPVVAKVFS